MTKVALLFLSITFFSQWGNAQSSDIIGKWVVLEVELGSRIMYNRYDSLLTLKSQYDFALELNGTLSNEDSIVIQNKIRKYNENMNSHSYVFLESGKVKAVVPERSRGGFKESKKNGRFYMKNNVLSIEIEGNAVEFYYKIEDYLTLKPVEEFVGGTKIQFTYIKEE